MEQAKSNSDSPRVFTREKWFVQLGMAARGIACCSKCGTSGGIVMQVQAFKLPCVRNGLAMGRSARSRAYGELVVNTHDACVRSRVSVVDSPLSRPSSRRSA